MKNIISSMMKSMMSMTLRKENYAGTEHIGRYIYHDLLSTNYLPGLWQQPNCEVWP